MPFMFTRLLNAPENPVGTFHDPGSFPAFPGNKSRAEFRKIKRERFSKKIPIMFSDIKSLQVKLSPVILQCGPMDRIRIPNHYTDSDSIHDTGE